MMMGLSGLEMIAQARCKDNQHTFNIVRDNSIGIDVSALEKLESRNCFYRNCHFTGILRVMVISVRLLPC